MQQLDLFAAINAPSLENKTTEVTTDVMPVLVPDEDIVINTGIEAVVEIIFDTNDGDSDTLSAQQEEAPFLSEESTAVIMVRQPRKTRNKDVDETPKVAGKRGRKSYSEMDADIVMVEVPDDEILFAKQYYGMSQVAEWFHVNQSLLRYWENEFDILKPRKTRKGDRLFRPEDIKNLQLIYFLLRQRKFSIEGAKQYLKDNRQKADVNMQLIQSLTKFRAFLLEWKANLGT